MDSVDLLDKYRAALKKEALQSLFSTDGRLSKIQLIKSHRMAFGTGLREAKEAVEAELTRIAVPYAPVDAPAVFRISAGSNVWYFRTKYSDEAIGAALIAHNASASRYSDEKVGYDAFYRLCTVAPVYIEK